MTTDERVRFRYCSQCEETVEFKPGEEAISLCMRCADTLANRVCRVEGCSKRRQDGFMFCASCLAQGATLLPLEESLFAGFVAVQRIRIPDDIRPDPLAAAERMCPEIQEEYAREFADRLTLKHVATGKTRINWPFILKTVSDAAPFAALGALFALFVIGAAIVVLGFAPGNEGVTFGGVR